MASVVWDYPRTGIWRFSRRDGILVMLAAAHGILLVLWPVAPVIAVGVWWNANTIAHNFIHRPFFRSAAMNRMFSALLSIMLGVPQRLWRDRHLAHHADVKWRLNVSRQLMVETALVVGLWAALATFELRFFLLAYSPGYLAALGLCAMQGYWEHAVGQPTSHYGHLYNFLCFNDGYHAEHHADPTVHWTELPHRVEKAAAISQWPPLMRWLDGAWLEALERVVLWSPWLQRLVLDRHRRAFRVFLPELTTVRTATIVGGGLFPRTALILRELLPVAHLTIVDSNPRNLETAREFLGADVEYHNKCFAPRDSDDCDLTVIPLCLQGDRAAIYRHPPSSLVLVHDWIWRRRGAGVIVSCMLLKRVNLVYRSQSHTSMSMRP
jgi:hypothetical protein